MALDDDVRILSGVGLFEGFTAEQLRLLAFGAETTNLPAQRKLYREDDVADSAYVVVSGGIVLYREEIGPGVPALQLADTSAWRVETDDLTELDVVRVAAGQRVTVIADALPDVALEGTVTSIAETSEVRAGEVLYQVTIDLPDPDPRLRWGMTVAVTFEE